MMGFTEMLGWAVFLLFCCAMMFFSIAFKAAKNPLIKSTGGKVGGIAVKRGGRWMIGKIVKKLG